jgi:hypothetical protein
LLRTVAFLISSVNVNRALFCFTPNPKKPKDLLQTSHAKIFKVHKLAPYAKEPEHDTKQMLNEIKWKIVEG